MAEIIKVISTTGKSYSFVDQLIGVGGMEEVYFAPDKSYVVVFFCYDLPSEKKALLEKIVGTYKEQIFTETENDFWAQRFCWPIDLIQHNGKLGLIVPSYAKHFFFNYGSRNNDTNNVKGTLKESKWFASAYLRTNVLDPKELGDWRKHLLVCLNIVRAVRRMHAAGLAHLGLSYKNILIDPLSGNSCLIGIVDGLYIPGQYIPDFLCFPDFSAPEIISSLALNTSSPDRKFPSQKTDQHALSVLIYFLLLYRHPLRGQKTYDEDDDIRDESLRMGSGALFIEHPENPSNRVDPAQLKKAELLWSPHKKPYTILGPYLKPLVELAFIKGLHDPDSRPTACDWESALVKSLDLLIPCTNPACEQKWFMYDNSVNPICPFCSAKFQGGLPVLNFYSLREAKYLSDDTRLMVYPGQLLHAWHVNSQVFPNEKLTSDQSLPVGTFELVDHKWHLLNQNIPGLIEKSQIERHIPVGSSVELKDNQQLFLSKEKGGRLIHIQMINH